MDANHNKRMYTYEYNYGSCTRVDVKAPDPLDPENPALGTVEKWWIQRYSGSDGRYVSAGVEDSDSNRTYLYYDDPDNAFLPTRVIDKNGKMTSFEYDDYGNLTKVTDPRGTETTYNLDYTDFVLGRISSVQVVNTTQSYNKTVAEYDYYEPSGLVQWIKTLKPGTTDGSTVQTNFTYDSLGNILTVDAPGNNAATRIVTTYNYTTDGGYSQSTKLGQPLTVTDNLGHVTHFRYDARGNIISVTDAIGNVTKYSYNIAGQRVLTVLPASQ